MTVTVLNLHFKGDYGKTIPACLRVFFLNFLGRLLKVTSNNIGHDTNSYPHVSICISSCVIRKTAHETHVDSVGQDQHVHLQSDRGLRCPLKESLASVGHGYTVQVHRAHRGPV